MALPAGSDRWTFCSEGHIHWGAHAGAGLLLRYVPRQGEPVHLLAERSRWVDEGGTWGIPGGAIHDGESPKEAARREAGEEIWPVPAYRVTGIDVQDCGGGWKFSIVSADVDKPFDAYAARGDRRDGLVHAQRNDDPAAASRLPAVGRGAHAAGRVAREQHAGCCISRDDPFRLPGRGGGPRGSAGARQVGPPRERGHRAERGSNSTPITMLPSTQAVP